jgi:Protein of unknown function (DUF938)
MHDSGATAATAPGGGIVERDLRLSTPSALRNRQPILAVLRRVLPASGVVLEIASGTGEHVRHFAAELPGLVFQPSDPDERARSSIAAWVASDGLRNVRAPLAIRAEDDDWGLGPSAGEIRAMININMIHISPWRACLGLLRGAAQCLPPSAPLVLYGPYRRGGQHTAPSNEAFDADLQRRNPDWGVRDLDRVAACAEERGLELAEVVEMPANNLCVVLRRSAG